VFDTQRYERLVRQRRAMTEGFVAAGDFFPACRAGTSLQRSGSLV
jgi:hypothetical protein